MLLRDVAPAPPPAGTGLIQLLADEALMRRLVGAESGDCVSALRSLNLDDSFWVWEFKVVNCSKTYSHKWTLCPCAHAGETARRRCPRQYSYKAVLCPLVKAKKTCPLGDACSYAHNVFEHWLHPSRYKTRLCSFGRNCNRPICFFAHSAEELRCVPNAEDNKGNDVDEREYLMQLVLAQESGLLNPASSGLAGLPSHSLADALPQPQAHSAGLPLLQPNPVAADLAALAQRLPPRLSTGRNVPSQLSAAAENALLMANLGYPAGNSLGPGSLPTGALSGAFERAVSMERAPSLPLDQVGPLPSLPTHHSSMRPVSRSACGQTGIPGFDFPVPGNPRSLMHGSSGSVNSVQSEPAAALTAASAAMQQGLEQLEALAAPLGRLSDPGMAASAWTHHSIQSAFANTVNPVPHLNRISDSGNTLGLITGLESLLPLMNSALVSGQLNLQRLSAPGTAAVSAPPSKPGSPVNGSQACSPPSPNTLLATATSAGSDGDARSESPEPAAAINSPTATVAAQHRASDTGMAVPVLPIAGAKANATAAAAAAALAAVTGGGKAPPNTAMVQNLMAHLQEQGLANNKEQLVASLSALLAQLLSVQ